MTGKPNWGSLAQVEGIPERSQVLSVNGSPVETVAPELELIPSRKIHSLTLQTPTGDIRVVLEAGGHVPWQTRLAGTVQALLAFLFWLAALMVWHRKPGLAAGHLFSLWSLSVAVLISSEVAAQYGLWGALAARTMAYIFLPALFLHFALSFPRALLPRRSKSVIPLTYLPAAILAVVYAAIAGGEAAFNTWFKQVVFIYLLVWLAAGVVALGYSYFTSTYERYRLQIQLLVASALLGMLLVLLLSLLPQVLYRRWIVPPNLPVLATALVPLSFAFVITREKLPTFTRDRKTVDSYSEARSISSFATLAGDLESMAAYLAEVVAGRPGVSDACVIVASGEELEIVAAAGEWAKDPLRRLQVLSWASKVTPDHIFPNLASPPSGWQLFVPLESHGELVGMLCLGAKKSGKPFTERDIELLAELRKQIALPLHNAILLNKVKQSREQLQAVLGGDQSLCQRTGAGKGGPGKSLSGYRQDGGSDAGKPGPLHPGAFRAGFPALPEDSPGDGAAGGRGGDRSPGSPVPRHRKGGHPRQHPAQAGAPEPPGEDRHGAASQQIGGDPALPGLYGKSPAPCGVPPRGVGRQRLSTGAKG